MSEANIMDKDRIGQTDENSGSKMTVAEKRTYSAEEVRALVQSEADRRVSGAKKRWEKELDERIESAAEQRAAHLAEGYTRRIAELEEDLSETRRNSERRERQLAIVSALESEGLPGDLLPLVEGVNAGGEAEAISALRRAIEERSALEFARRLPSKAPIAGDARRTLTSAEICALPVAVLAERMKR